MTIIYCILRTIVEQHNSCFTFLDVSFTVDSSKFSVDKSDSCLDYDDERNVGNAWHTIRPVRNGMANRIRTKWHDQKKNNTHTGILRVYLLRDAPFYVSS